jgi:hypothetical protein
MTKREVVEYLGRSERTIETWISSGTLPCEYIKGKFGKVTSFRRAVVEALKRDIDQPTVRALPTTNGVPAHLKDLVDTRAAIARATAPDLTPRAQLIANAIVQSRPEPPKALKAWLSLQAAVEYSGLPAWKLLELARAGEIRAYNLGRGGKQRWRFNRIALTK